MITTSHPHWRDAAVAIFKAALAAVDPARLVAQHLTTDGDWVVVHTATTARVARWRAPTLVVGAGKAAARMAAACEQILGAAHVNGQVIVADGCGAATESIQVAEAGHPLPDSRGTNATRRLLELVRKHGSGATLCLISGGASSLLVQPRPPVGLEDKTRTTELLLKCGADIGELNCVRKHLSIVKGGGLARLTTGTVAGLLISDVVGDDPGTIGSGPTAPDPTTFQDAWTVLDRYGLTARVPATVAKLLRNGMDGRIEETLKRGGPDAQRITNVIIGSNYTALHGAAERARSDGWQVVIEDQQLTGDTTEAARRFAARLRAMAEQCPRGGLCVLAGGETTVRVRGRGRGGRNQEFALALADALAGSRFGVLSVGTDGIDGPTDAAGAFVDGASLGRAVAMGLDCRAALGANDSYTFFDHLGDLHRCGPTGTNVMDLKIALLPR